MTGTLALIVLALVICHVQAQITVNDCPPTLPRDRYLKAFGSSCYQFVTSHERDFHSAERECESRRGHLVTVRNSGVQNFLYHTLQSEFHFDGILWVGLTDESSEGHYTWIDGSPVHYTYWADGQPGSIVGFLEDCAGMDMSDGGHWNDYRCDGFLFITSQHYFVCEYPVTVITTTTTTTTTTQSPIVSTATALPVTDATPGPTPEPTTAVTTAAMTSTPVNDVTHSHAHTTHPHTGHHIATTTQCPPFECGLDCGLSGYVLNPDGCMLCQCES